MPEFTASDPGSSFPNQNILFNSAAGITGQEIQKNQLGLQSAQIDLSNAHVAQLGQAAAGLLSAYPDEASRAAAWPQFVGMLQSQGSAMHAPSQYPGEGVLRSMVNMGLAPKDLYSSGALMTPAQQQLLGQTGQSGTASTAAPGTTTGTAAPSSVPIPARGTGGPGASASAPTAWLPYFEEASQKTGIPVDLLIAQARQESGFQADAKGAAGEIGTFQIKPSTAANPGFGMAGVDPASITGPDNVRNNIMFGAQYLRARMGSGDPTNPAVQAAGLHAYNAGGDPNYVANVFRYRPTMAPSDPNAAVTAYTPPTIGATTATAAPAGGGGMPRSYQVASTAPTAPPGSTAAPAAAPAPLPPDQAVAQAKATGQAVPVAGSQGLWALPNGNMTSTPPAPAPASPAQPAPAPAAAPASTSRLPDASTIPTGQNSAPYKQAMQIQQQAMQYDAVAGSNPAFAKRAADLRLQAQQILQAGATVSAQQNGREGELEVVTGKFTPYQALPSPRFTGGAAVYNKTTGGWDQPTPATQADAVQGHWGVSGSGAPQFFPEAGVPAQASYKVAESQYDRDSKEIAGIADAGRMAQADQIRINEMQDVLQRFSSGPGTDARTAAASFLQRWLPAAVTGWEKQSANLSGAEAAQAFSKLALAGAGSAERSVLGNRGGFQAIKMFQAANPNVDLQDATNKSILDMQLISNQANQDYSQGAQAHFAQNEKSFGGPTHQYTSLAQFDTAWNAQRNPQVFAAAMGAIGGQPSSQWAKGLSDDEYARALQIVQRAKPSAIVQTKNGPYSMQPNAVTNSTSAAPGTKVIRFDHNGNVIQ